MFRKFSERPTNAYASSSQNVPKESDSLFSLENTSNSRGWLEPTSVQVNPSRSIDRKSKKPKEMVNQQDVLGAVSDEDILKLAKLTAILPEVNKSKRIHNRHRSVESQTRHEYLEDDPSQISSDKITSDLPNIKSDNSNDTSNTDLVVLEGDKKRASWLYKSILKKSKSKGKTEEFDESYHTRHSDSSSISSNHSSEHIPTSIIPNEHISRVHTINIASTSSIPHKHDIKNRRHSFDSFHSFTRAEHPPHIHNDNDSVEIQHPYDNRIDKEKITIHENDMKKTFIFDYESLPTEVKGLIDKYEQNGDVIRKKVMIKHIKNDHTYKENQDNDDDDEDDDNDEMMNDMNEDDSDSSEYETMDIKNVITGYVSNEAYNEPREIAIVTASPSDNIEFRKLVQLSTDTENGPLLDLCIFFFGDEADTHQENVNDLLTSVEDQLESLESFQSASRAFLVENEEAMHRLHLSGLTGIADQDDAVEIRDDAFENRHDEILIMLQTLKHELQSFKGSLKETKRLIQRIQHEMDDTRNIMEVYIKDIPESHYSALKKLEVDIELILSRRAKNPWLDTGYAILSYLLTGKLFFFPIC
ncbi:hypothetical protein RMATCC62417_17804 [Rhizopus microsporus]|nr:hypothetical protein RMATCC62417_17804 [Rhizopus microsporus]